MGVPISLLHRLSIHCHFFFVLKELTYKAEKKGACHIARITDIDVRIITVSRYMVLGTGHHAFVYKSHVLRYGVTLDD